MLSESLDRCTANNGGLQTNFTTTVGTLPNNVNVTGGSTVINGATFGLNNPADGSNPVNGVNLTGVNPVTGGNFTANTTTTTFGTT